MKKFTILLLLVSITSVFSQKSSYNIGILLDNRSTKLEPLILELENQIRGVVGEDAIIYFPENSILTNDFNKQKAAENYNKLINGTTDIILAFGLINGTVINKQTSHKKPTILFGAINKDVVDFDLSKQTSGIQNLTYLVEPESFIEDLKKFKKLTNFQKVGIAIEENFVKELPLKKVFDKQLKIVGGSYKIIPFNSVSDIRNNLESIDAIYMAGGFFLKTSEEKELAQLFINKKLPSFSVGGIKSVEQGMMATNQSNDNLSQIFRRISLTVEGYINGTPLAEMPIFIDYNPRLTINYNTASAIGIPIKYSLLNTTDFIGDFKDPTAEKEYNLLTVMEQLLGRNLSLQSSKKNIEISEQNIKTAKSNYLPSITASANGTYIDPKVASNINPEFSTGGKITLNQTIYSPSATANISIQKNLKKAQEESYNIDELNTVFNASNTYFNTLILKANAKILMRNLELTKRNLQIAKENYEVGESGKSDILRFRSELAQNTQSMVQAINQLQQSYIALNQILNNPIEMPINVEEAALDQGLYKNYNYEFIANILDDPTSREPFIEFLIEEAKVNAPELKSLEYTIKANQRNIKLSGSNRFIPTVALQGQYNRTFNRSGVGSTVQAGTSFVDANYNAGINLSIPIFNQNQNNINRQTAIIQKEQLEINRENSELNIASNVRNSVLSLVNQISNIQLSKVSEQTAKESLDLTQLSYQEGAVNFVQLIDAQNNYLNAQLSKANAVYNFLINVVQLERTIGYYFLLHTTSENEKFSERFQQYLLNKN